MLSCMLVCTCSGHACASYKHVCRCVHVSARRMCVQVCALSDALRVPVCLLLW